jgi:hypothetical protein
MSRPSAWAGTARPSVPDRERPCLPRLEDASRRVTVTARSTPASRTGLDGHVNYILVMRNERDDLVAIGPVSIEYQAAMIRDELEESASWTTVGIARVLTEEQARTIAAATGA